MRYFQKIRQFGQIIFFLFLQTFLVDARLLQKFWLAFLELYVNQSEAFKFQKKFTWLNFIFSETEKSEDVTEIHKLWKFDLSLGGKQKTAKWSIYMMIFHRKTSLNFKWIIIFIVVKITIIGKKYAIKTYDLFTLHASCFYGSQVADYTTKISWN